ncbi:MAG: AAA family ATPase [Alicyclobacillus sp.]|nr:AAA family ATPase [Alicyclobacillus sp.]
MPGTTSHLIAGRDRELRILETQLLELLGGRGGLMLITGESGVGKTTLVREAIAGAPTDMMTSRCPGVGETPVFGPWLELIDRIQRTWHVDPPADLLQRHASDRSMFNTAITMMSWLRQLPHPFVWIVEDLQWADTATLELLCHVADRMDETGVLILATCRSDGLIPGDVNTTLFHELSRHCRERLHLTCLNRTDVDFLVRTLLTTDTTGPGSTPANASDLDALISDIFTRTAGLPLFVRELLDIIWTRGALPDLQRELPANLAQAIDRKIQQLHPDTQSLLELAALIGERFSCSVLEMAMGGRAVTDEYSDSAVAAGSAGSVMGVAANTPNTADVARTFNAAVASAVGEAMARGILVPDDGDTVRFHHAMVRDVMLHRCVGSRRKTLHERIASAILSLHPDQVEAVAFHLHQAQHPEAVPYLIAAADKAWQAGAIVTACRRYEAALADMSADHPHEATTRLKLAYGLRRSHPERAIHCARQALDSALRQNAGAVAVWARHLLLWMAFQRNDFSHWTEMEELAAEQAALLGNPEYQALEVHLFGTTKGFPLIRSLQINQCMWQGKLDVARQMLNEITPLAAPESMEILEIEAFLSTLEGDLRSVAQINRRVCESAWVARQYWNALRCKLNELYFSELVNAHLPDMLNDIAQQLVDMEQKAAAFGGQTYLAKGYSGIGFHEYGAGHWAQAWHNVIDYVRTEEDALPIIRWFGAVMLTETGDLEGAKEVLRQLPPKHPEDELPTASTVFVWTHAVWAQVAIGLGDLDLARTWLDAADAHPLGTVSNTHRPYVDLAWAAYHRAAGAHDLAWRLAESALERAQRQNISWFVMKALRLLGELASAKDDKDGAMEYFTGSRTLAVRCRYPFEQAMTDLSMAKAHLQFGNEVTALEFASSARAAFGRLGADRWLAKADALLKDLPSTGTGLDLRALNIASPGADPPLLLNRLTRREQEVVRLVIEGRTDRDIAAQLFLSPKTVDHHLRSVFRKLDVNNRAALVALLLRAGQI